MTNEKTIRLEASITPQGHIHVDWVADTGDLNLITLPAGVAQRIFDAFQKGTAPGLLHLAGPSLSEELPPTLSFWRGLARIVLQQLCALPDLELKRNTPFDVPAPAQELSTLIADIPPMLGGEYISSEILTRLWQDLVSHIQHSLSNFKGSASEYLHALNPAWNLVGRVCFHLAENKQNTHQPFAFLATYTNRLSTKASVQHLPLGRAIQEFSAAADKSPLVALLKPVQLAAESSATLKKLIDSGEIFHPLAWTPQEAYRFLKDIPKFEAAGVVVRVPDWWQAKKPPRPEVKVTVGKNGPSGIGLDSILDFDVQMSLGDETLTQSEWQAILKNTSGLVSIKGRWVELDKEKLTQVLDHWRDVQKSVSEEGLSFASAMRLLAGASDLGGKSSDNKQLTERAEWQQVIAGEWLAKTLANLKNPSHETDSDPGSSLKAHLRPYQKSGVQWLWHLHRLRLGACLADDMGLGKTIQVLSLLLLMKKSQSRSILVVPTSLINNWLAEAERFAPSLKTFILHPSTLSRIDDEELIRQKIHESDLTITTYGLLNRFDWLANIKWDLAVLDEAQAIKNPDAKQTIAAKSLKTHHRIALTGTPVENRLSDLWSLFDFICPGLLGTGKEFTKFLKTEKNPYPALRKLAQPYILRRLKTDRSIISDLPEKTELQAFCGLTKLQASLYEKSVKELTQKLDEVDGIQRRGIILSYLMRFKQICNHPSQWLGDGDYDAAASGKFSRLSEICEEIASRQEKALVFTQFREMTGPLSIFLEKKFGKKGLVLHGEISVKQRKSMVDTFQSEDGPPFFILSLKAGGTGLNLTAASHVIHFDRWWNPAVENQATDRAFRIGQKRNVLVHKFICRGTIEERIDAMIEEKKIMASEVLEGSGESILTELNNEDLIKLVSLDLKRAVDAY